jgi:hypothetical protein
MRCLSKGTPKPPTAVRIGSAAPQSRMALSVLRPGCGSAGVSPMSSAARRKIDLFIIQLKADRLCPGPMRILPYLR